MFFKKLISKLKSPSTMFRERAPRVKIAGIHRVEFVVLSTTKTERVRVVNLSTSGVALSGEGEATWRALGGRITGQLSLKGKEFRVTLEIRHITPAAVGCRFISTEESLAQEISKFLNLELAALKLRPVRSDILSINQPGVPTWFVDGKGNELYLLEETSVLQSFHLTFLGHYVDWKKGGSPRVGHFVKDEDRAAPKHKASDRVAFLNPPPQGLGELAVRFVSGIEKLDSNQRDQIVAALKGLQ